MATQTDKIQRSVLPIPDRPRTGLITYDAKDPDTKYPPIEQLRPPEGAPNVLVVLLDDAGFGAASAFGGPCQTPAAARLAAGGLKYNRFHTTALCSPQQVAGWALKLRRSWFTRSAAWDCPQGRLRLRRSRRSTTS